jgi:hypothetical protein
MVTGMETRIFLLATAVMAAATVSARSPSSPEASERPDLSGRWRLNPDKSENAEEKVRQAVERMLSAEAGVAAASAATREVARAVTVLEAAAGEAALGWGATGKEPCGKRCVPSSTSPRR